MSTAKTAQTIATRHRTNKKASDRRILILDPEKAKPNSEAWHFLKRQSGNCGKACIEVIQQPDCKQITISEDLCAVCLARAKQCPGGAVKIVQIPSDLTTDPTHRYGQNSFKLHGLPMPRPGQVLGLLGTNGIGKSTAIDILAGKIKPNLGVGTWSGEGTAPPTWSDIVRYYRGSDLQNYFNRMIEGRLQCVIKPQLDAAKITRYLDGNRKVGDVLREREERGNLDEMVERLELSHLLEREVRNLSGGELQRVVICAVIIRDTDVYLFDEPSSFLDARQRLVVADAIRSLIDPDTQHARGPAAVAAARQSAASKYIILVEHDLTLLDYASDYVSCLYGNPGAYGVVAKRSKANRGINQFLAGYLASENVRFRAEELTFKVSVQDMEANLTGTKEEEFAYPAMTKRLQSNDSSRPTTFTLHVQAGHFRDGEVVGIIGQNGVGKSTFMEMLVHHLDRSVPATTLDSESDSVNKSQLPPSAHPLLAFGVSYKPQHLGSRFSKFKGTVQQFLEKHIQHRLGDRMFRLLVMRPLSMDKMEDLQVRSLSGGERQRLAICVCLGTPAFVYMIDEPSAGLDCEQRLVVSKIIKRWVVSHLGKTAFVIEHDLLMASALYDRVVLFQGKPGIECSAGTPVSPMEGLNRFLQQLGITVRRDPANHRLRINKRGCRRDREQKASGVYFSLESAEDE